MPRAFPRRVLTLAVPALPILAASAMLVMSALAQTPPPGAPYPIAPTATVPLSTATPQVPAPPSPSPTAPTPVSAAPRLALSFSAQPSVARAGDTVTYTARLRNPGPSAASGVAVSATLPANLAYLTAAARGSYDPRGRRLTWSLASLGAGQTVTLTFQARLESDAEPELVSVVQGTAASPFQGVAARALLRVIGAAPEEARITTEAGGVLRSRGRRVQVEFPPQAAREELVVRYTPRDDAGLREAGSLGVMFDLEAWTIRGAPVVTFARPLTVVVSYAQLELPPLGENWLSLFYYEPIERTWKRVPGVVDRTRQAVVARLDHFTSFDLMVSCSTSEGNCNKPPLPRLDEYGVDLFNGAATASYPIWTPPSAAGYSPVLRYNSSTPDGMTAETNNQAAWTGLGWSLDTGYIVRDWGANPNVMDDDSFSVSFGGLVSELVCTGANCYESFGSAGYQE